MNTKCLFVCNTPFQIMTAVSFKLTLLKDDEVDIIVSNIIHDAKILTQNIMKTNVFNNVYYFEDYSLNFKHKKQGWFNKGLELLTRRSCIRKALSIEKSYDKLFTSDTLKTIDWIYDLLYSMNRELKVFYFEESPIAVMCDQGNHFKEPSYYSSGVKRFIQQLLGVRHINGNWNGAYSTVSKEMSKLYFDWYEMPRPDVREMSTYVAILNQFWKYKKNNIDKARIVFIEESFFIDGYENCDEEIINDLRLHFDEGKILIKLHPRTRVNRFDNKMIGIYKNTSVPWELIALNGDLDNLIVICMASSAAIFPKLFWGINQSSFVLVDCKDYHFNRLNDEYYQTFSKICHEKKLAYMPKNKEEFLDLLSKKLTELDLIAEGGTR